MLVTCLAHAEPKVMGEKKEKTRHAVVVCYGNRGPACKALKKKLKEDCKPPLTLIDIPDDALPEEAKAKVEEKIKDGVLPTGTPVFVLGHGMEMGKTSEPHRISTPRQKVHNFKTEDLMSVLKVGSAQPAYWISACHAGAACDNTQGYCVGGICQANEIAREWPGTLDPATQAMAELYCDPDKFDRTDTDHNGEVSPIELAGYFCNEADHGRPYLEFEPHGEGDALNANIEKVKELATLYLEKALAAMGKGEFPEAKSKRLKALAEENDKLFVESKKLLDAYNSRVAPLNELYEKRRGIPRTGRKEIDAEIAEKEASIEAAHKTLKDFRAKHHELTYGFGGQMRASDYESGVQVYLQETGFKGPVSKMKWKERSRPSQYPIRDTEHVLMWEFPPSEARACVWMHNESTKTYRQYFPNIKKFSLQFYPGTVQPDAGQATSALPANTAPEHKGVEP